MSMESAPLFSSMTPASLSSTTHAFTFTFSTPSRQSSGDKKGNVSSSSGQSTRGEKEDVSSASGKSTRGKRAGTLGHQTPGSARCSGFRTPAVPTARTVLASRQSGLTSSPTSVSSVGAGQITPNLAQNTFGGGLLGSSVNTGFTGKNVVGGLGQQAPVVGREGVTAGSQIGQCQIGRSQDVLADIRVVGPSSLGSPVLGADDSAGGNIQLPSTTTVAEQPRATAADMHKVWEVLHSANLTFL